MKIKDKNIPWPEIGSPMIKWVIPENMELNTRENVEASREDVSITIEKGTTVELKTFENMGMLKIAGHIFTY